MLVISLLFEINEAQEPICKGVWQVLQKSFEPKLVSNKQQEDVEQGLGPSDSFWLLHTPAVLDNHLGFSVSLVSLPHLYRDTPVL